MQRTKLEDVQELLRYFAADRDWEQFHTPKNLAIALSVEASELLELFQWLTPEQSWQLGDVLIALDLDEGGTATPVNDLVTFPAGAMQSAFRMPYSIKCR